MSDDTPAWSGKGRPSKAYLEWERAEMESEFGPRPESYEVTQELVRFASLMRRRRKRSLALTAEYDVAIDLACEFSRFFGSLDDKRAALIRDAELESPHLPKARSRQKQARIESARHVQRGAISFGVTYLHRQLSALRELSVTQNELPESYIARWELRVVAMGAFLETLH